MRVIEIFSSIDGEVNGFSQGRPTTFIRLSGCNLRCSYCDTPESLSGLHGADLSIEDILNTPEVTNSKNITITGGEPLLWLDKGFDKLLYALVARGKKINIETNGTIVPPKKLMLLVDVTWTVDFKIGAELSHIFTPDKLRESDTIKIIITSPSDLVFSASYIREYAYTPVTFALSPDLSAISAQDVADFIIKNQLNALLNIQLHKFINLK